MDKAHCARNRPVAFLIFHPVVCDLFHEVGRLGSRIHARSRMKIIKNVWKIKNATGGFPAELHTPNMVNAIPYLVSLLCFSKMFKNSFF